MSKKIGEMNEWNEGRRMKKNEWLGGKIKMIEDKKK